MKKEGTEEGNKPNNRPKTTKKNTGASANIDTQNRKSTTRKSNEIDYNISPSRATRTKRGARRIEEMTMQVQRATQKQSQKPVKTEANIAPQTRTTSKKNGKTSSHIDPQTRTSTNKKSATTNKKNVKKEAYANSQTRKTTKRNVGEETYTNPQNRKPRTKREIGEMREKQKTKNKRELKEEKRQEKKRRKQEKKERRKKSIPWKIFKTLVILLILSGIAYGCYFAYRMEKNGGGLQGFMATALGHDENTLKDLEPIQFLLVGISGEEEYKLADTIMVCSYNPKTQKAAILSIPRDTYVGKDKTKASASYKINSVYRNGENLEGMVNHLEELTELEIDNYLVIDTKALVQLVDALGGITFDVPIDMDYDDPTQDLYIHLKAGVQKLDGKQAEGLVRFRHSNDLSTYPTEYGDNDIGRMRTQREFITQVMKQTVRPENLLKLVQIAEIGFKNITTNMTFDTIKDYLPYAVNFNPEELKTGTLPGEAELANKVWIYTPNIKQTKKLVEELFIEEREIQEDEQEENTNTVGNTIPGGNTTSSVTQPKIKIELLNGSGSEKNLTKAVEQLEQKGYEVVKKGNTKTTTKTSIINRSNQEDSVSKKLKQALKYGTISKKYNNSQVDYTIILGKDYK